MSAAIEFDTYAKPKGKRRWTEKYFKKKWMEMRIEELTKVPIETKWPPKQHHKPLPLPAAIMQVIKNTDGLTVNELQRIFPDNSRTTLFSTISRMVCKNQIVAVGHRGIGKSRGRVYEIATCEKEPIS